MDRIIPACAGSTRVTASLVNLGTGSSPRARGAPKKATCIRAGSRIIPACAGSTPLLRHRPPFRRDHPRVRGEHQDSSSGPENEGGSSPRARGARVGSLLHVLVLRIIPACAGSTSPKPPCRRAERDHPRVRGEHRGFVSVNDGPAGSSPRARGALVLTSRLLSLGRIIPACAGSTLEAQHSAPGKADHPRVRGEHSRRLRANEAAEGSSPRARGARGRYRHVQNLRGIIPACAGSTESRRLREPSSADHPRVRGEHT